MDRDIIERALYKLNSIQNELSKMLTNQAIAGQRHGTQDQYTQGHDGSAKNCSTNKRVSVVDEANEVHATVEVNKESDQSVVLRRDNQKKVKSRGCVAALENNADCAARTQFEPSSIRDEAVTTSHRRSFKESKQECLRKALQQNIVLLVDTLPYSENDILDMLIENECLTEVECSDLRDNGSRKDRVRNLVRIIKGRSFKVLKIFVNCVKKIHPEVAASIWQVYERLAKDKESYIKKCTFCVLKRSVDIKAIADLTWSTGAISDQLYAEIVDERVKTEVLWQQLAEEYNIAPRTVRQNTLRTISEALMKKGQYRDLVLKLNKMPSSLQCTCVKMEADSNNLLPNIIVTDVDELSSVSPRSTPASSRSLADVNENSVASDDGSPINEHENYFLSVRTVESDKSLYSVCFGSRQRNSVEFLKPRPNSIGREPNDIASCRDVTNRRRSMFFLTHYK